MNYDLFILYKQEYGCNQGGNDNEVSVYFLREYLYNINSDYHPEYYQRD